MQRDLSNQDTWKEIEALGGQCRQILCDLEDQASVKSLVARVTSDLGATIDILVVSRSLAQCWY
jgi:NAD(P)-dependent dehydrogenase (short-subunit alcohol dehydrogenase family)